MREIWRQQLSQLFLFHQSNRSTFLVPVVVGPIFFLLDWDSFLSSLPFYLSSISVYWSVSRDTNPWVQKGDIGRIQWKKSCLRKKLPRQMTQEWIPGLMPFRVLLIQLKNVKYLLSFTFLGILFFLLSNFSLWELACYLKAAITWLIKRLFSNWG